MIYAIPITFRACNIQKAESFTLLMLVQIPAFEWMWLIYRQLPYLSGFQIYQTGSMIWD